MSRALSRSSSRFAQPVVPELRSGFAQSDPGWFFAEVRLKTVSGTRLDPPPTDRVARVASPDSFVPPTVLGLRSCQPFCFQPSVASLMVAAGPHVRSSPDARRFVLLSDYEASRFPLCGALLSSNVVLVAHAASRPGTRFTFGSGRCFTAQTRQADFLTRGRPLGVAKAPCSFERSCLIWWTRTTFPCSEICTDPATMATSTLCPRQLRPTR